MHSFSLVFLLLCGSLFLDSSPIQAAEEAEKAAPDTTAAPEEEKKEDDQPSFEEVVEDFEKIEGLFTLYRDEEENKVYMEILPHQFDRIFLCSITREKGDGYYFDSAAMLYSFPFAFERVGKKVFFVHRNVYYRADEDAAIHRAIGRGLSNSIMGTASIEGQPHPETGAVLVEPSGFFLQDIGMVSFIFSEYIKAVTYSFDQDNSYLGSLKSFPENTEIEAVLHFSSTAPKEHIPTLPDNRSFQHTYHYSLFNLPETDFKPRLADDRVGHFLTMHQDYTSVLKDSPYIRYIDRWHLEKAEPKFKVSPPKKPIVFWLENTIPVEYREAVAEGILLWNKAFERIGFKDAIVVEQQPDDAEWDPADARYSTVRWIVHPGGGYAVGPSWTNPFTGQIYDADIRISADYLRYVFREYTEFVDPISARRVAAGDSIATALGLMGNYARGYCDMEEGAVQEAAFAWRLLEARSEAEGIGADLEEFLRQLIVELVAHEVGHTLGLRHNFKASTIHRADQLSDTKVTAAEGISGSLMDYNPVNLAREGERQGHYFQNALGPYDYWAIEYAYRPIEADSPESEKAVLDKIASRVAEPQLTYGTDEDAFWWTQGIDPSCSRWDLSEDPIGFYRERVVLSRELWGKVEEKFEKKGTRYQKLRQVFGQGFRPYWTGVGNVAKYIGGIYHHRDHVGDPKGRRPLVPVPPAKQREALAFLTEHVFGPDAFHWSPELLNKLAPERWWDFSGSVWRQQRIDFPVHAVVLSIQRSPLNRLYDPILLNRLQDLELRCEDGEAFTMPELFGELRQAIWAELDREGNVNSFRRNLQRLHLEKLVGLVVKPSPDIPPDSRSLARADLQAIGEGCERVAARPDVDAYTRAHLDETRAIIKAALAAGLDRHMP